MSSESNGEYTPPSSIAIVAEGHALTNAGADVPVPSNLDIFAPALLPIPEGEELLKHSGSCFCGKYTFTVKHPRLEARPPASCNCRWCSITAGCYIFVDEHLFQINGDDGNIGNMPRSEGGCIHYFCEKCSSNIYWRGLGRVGVNVRLFEGVDLANIQPTFLDRKN